MKIVAKIKPTSQETKYEIEVDAYGAIKQLQNIEEDKFYSVEIKKLASKRSLEQNKFFWALLKDIVLTQNDGIPESEWNTYINLLKESNIRYEILIILPEAEYMLDKFRAKEFMQNIIVSGVEMHMWKCFIGQSEMNTKEMKLLIDRALDLAANVGCDMSYWDKVFER